ncbi:Putative addiction module component, CHP02574 [Desulfonema limicola]|uniref:Addiction module component, CHP02574 n=1 Tax=Desulfonema limicola TaxID=45656 RepID=A0A975BEM2_9BACT|nr:addiction module protein [Desulfonema limicola]QTA83695.1 Putative addiction module component, CHP02574 [Desulfonema limicola]
MMIKEIKQMDIIKRIQLMEALWDSLLYDETDFQAPEWHKNILSERKRKIDEGKAEFVSIKELKASKSI